MAQMVVARGMVAMTKGTPTKAMGWLQTMDDVLSGRRWEQSWDGEGAESLRHRVQEVCASPVMGGNL